MAREYIVAAGDDSRAAIRVFKRRKEDGKHVLSFTFLPKYRNWLSYRQGELARKLNGETLHSDFIKEGSNFVFELAFDSMLEAKLALDSMCITTHSRMFLPWPDVFIRGHDLLLIKKELFPKRKDNVMRSYDNAEGQLILRIDYHDLYYHSKFYVKILFRNDLLGLGELPFQIAGTLLPQLKAEVNVLREGYLSFRLPSEDKLEKLLHLLHHKKVGKWTCLTADEFTAARDALL